ncbi:MAG: hypothetical protein GX535_14050 [Xanthomonadaceae bacterium]|nr:hypothetical protein [Xanthomonadaceae bacterium]
MANRATLFVLALLSFAMSTVLVTSFAAIDMDNPAYTPIEEAASASDTDPPHEGSKERTESNGKAQPTPQETDRSPRADDTEPLGKPMLASYRAQKLAAA